MTRVEQIGSFILLMIYSLGIAHGAIPHSHYAESTDSPRCEYDVEQNVQCDAGWMGMLINLFSEAEFTDIADLFVGASVKKLPLDDAKAQLAAVLVSFITVDINEDELTVALSQAEPDLSYHYSHVGSSSRRGPPTVF